MIGREFADSQLRRMMGIPYFRKIGPEGFGELLRVAMETAREDAHLEAAITALLADTARASNRETNVPPTPGELVQWIRQAQGDDVYAEQRCSHRTGCGRCDGGWVFVTRRIIPRGQTLPQGYTFAGKCPICYGPGWYAGNS